MDDRTSPPRKCEVCGTPLRKNNATGICGGKGKLACRQARRRKIREGFTAPEKPASVRTGEIRGYWTALETGWRENARILCRCVCGTERRVRCWSLNSGKSRDCGCIWRTERVMRGGAPYLAAGSIYGRFTVLEDVPRCDGMARCRCECGKEVEIRAVVIKHGISSSCGCLSDERRSRLGGFSKHPLYHVWNSMIDRCTNPKDLSYENYGGRGIRVCERWMDPWAFAADVERECGSRPEDVNERGRHIYSFDRIDVNGNYENGNVRWATPSEQVLNQRKVRTLTTEVRILTGERDVLSARVEALERELAETRGVLF